MGAIKSSSRWGWLIAAVLFTLSNSGCMITDSYSFRPGHWFVHNLFPSTCKTCPGGLPGPDGCRTFRDPYCAGYQTTMWREIGIDCGPARTPESLAWIDQPQPTLNNGEAGAETQPGDQAPALPDNFPSPLPNPVRQPTPLPELPLDGLGTPEDDPFPVKPVPSTPDGDEPDDGPPKVSPDLFPESRPGTGNTPAPKTPAPKSPVTVPDNIDDLFTPPTTQPPAKVPSALPPAKTPAKPLPNLTEPAAEPKQTETLPEPQSKPAPKTGSPALPFDETPSLEDTPDLFPESKKKPSETKEPQQQKEEQPSVPKLFEDSSYEQLPRMPEAQSTLKFGRVLPVSMVQDSAIRVQQAGGPVELQPGLRGTGEYPASSAPTSLRILQP